MNKILKSLFLPLICLASLSSCKDNLDIEDVPDDVIIDTGEDDDDDDTTITDDYVSIILSAAKIANKLKKLDNGCYKTEYTKTFTEESGSFWHTSTSKRTQSGSITSYNQFKREQYQETKKNKKYTVTFETGITKRNKEDNFYQIHDYPIGYGEDSYVIYAEYSESLENTVFGTGFSYLYVKTLYETLVDNLSSITDYEVTTNFKDVDLTKDGEHILSYRIGDSSSYYEREDTITIENGKIINSISEVESNSLSSYLSLHCESSYSYSESLSNYSGTKLNPKNYQEKEILEDEDDGWDDTFDW